MRLIEFLTEARNVQDIQAFQKWFAGSKVVDSKGQPLKVFHGTPQGGFEEFNSQKWNGIAGYFHTDPEFSNICAAGSRWKAGEPTNDDSQGHPCVYPVYLALKRPLELTHIDGQRRLSAELFLRVTKLDVSKSPHYHKWYPIRDKSKTAETNYIRQGISNVPVWEYLSSHRVLDVIKANGYDGVMYDEHGPAFVAFYPEQVKSVFNPGTFDPYSSNISESLGRGRTLYHGTLRKYVQDIARIGLFPSLGEFTRQAYADHIDAGTNLANLVFAADKEGLSAAYSAISAWIRIEYPEVRFPYEREAIARYGALCVIKRGGDDFKYADWNSISSGMPEYLTHVEPGNYYTDRHVKVDYILTGQKLVAFFDRFKIFQYYKNFQDHMNAQEAKLKKRTEKGLARIEETYDMEPMQIKNRTVGVFNNVSGRDFRRILHDHSVMRGLILSTGPVYIWDGYDAAHFHIIDVLDANSRASGAAYYFVASRSLQTLLEENDWGAKVPIYQSGNIYFMFSDQYLDYVKNVVTFKRLFPNHQYVGDNGVLQRQMNDSEDL